MPPLTIPIYKNFFTFFLPIMRNKKGHRYIVPTQGQARPKRDTQAVPRTGALTLVRSRFQNLPV
jgi:hypothetical protein